MRRHFSTLSQPDSTPLKLLRICSEGSVACKWGLVDTDHGSVGLGSNAASTIL